MPKKLMTEEQLKEIGEWFIQKIRSPERIVPFPKEKAKSPFIVATIGLTGSGRSTVARRIIESVPGAVYVQSNSARKLINEDFRQYDLKWGENIRKLLKYAADRFLSEGYGVVFDGNAADVEDRENIRQIAEPSGAKVFYVRINIASEIAKEREKKRYDDPNWASSFDDYRVNTPEKMVKNIDDRAELHRTMKSSDIPNLIAEIDNNDSMEKLQRQVEEAVAKI